MAVLLGAPWNTVDSACSTASGTEAQDEQKPVYLLCLTTSESVFYTMA